MFSLRLGRFKLSMAMMGIIPEKDAPAVRMIFGKVIKKAFFPFLSQKI